MLKPASQSTFVLQAITRADVASLRVRNIKLDKGDLKASNKIHRARNREKKRDEIATLEHERAHTLSRFAPLLIVLLNFSICKWTKSINIVGRRKTEFGAVLVAEITNR